jgi:hypothetical protein
MQVVRIAAIFYVTLTVITLLNVSIRFRDDFPLINSVYAQLSPFSLSQSNLLAVKILSPTIGQSVDGGAGNFIVSGTSTYNSTDDRNNCDIRDMKLFKDSVISMVTKKIHDSILESTK